MRWILVIIMIYCSRSFISRACVAPESRGLKFLFLGGSERKLHCVDPARMGVVGGGFFSPAAFFGCFDRAHDSSTHTHCYCMGKGCVDTSIR